jgi:hypothetical protein
MLYLNISISNPWFKRTENVNDYKNLFSSHGSLSKHKHWEVEAFKDLRKILGVELSLSWRGKDHAGVEIGACLLGRDIALRIYDTRHWDYQNDTWVKDAPPNKPPEDELYLAQEKKIDNEPKQSNVLVSQDITKIKE